MLRKKGSLFPLFLYNLEYYIVAILLFCFSLFFSVLYPGIPSLFYRDQLSSSVNQTINGVVVYHYKNCALPYYCYPFEYPFFSGFLQFLVNIFSRNFEGVIANTPAPLLASVLFSGFLVSLSAALIVILYKKMNVLLYKVLIFYAILPAIVYQLDVSFDIIGALLWLLSYYYLRKETLSSVLLALSAGTKLLPLLLLPAFLTEVKNKKRYAATFFSIFFAGVALQILLSPVNFLRYLHFESNYGIEGSWLGLIFKSAVINYSTVKTWIIGNETHITLNKLGVYLTSAVITLSLSLFFSTRKIPLQYRIFLIFVSEVFGLWISPPQFAFNIFVAAPLVLTPRARTIVSYWLISIFDTPAVLGSILHFFGINTHVYGWTLPNYAWSAFGAVTQFGFLFIAISDFWAIRKDIFTFSLKRAYAGFAFLYGRKRKKTTYNSTAPKL